MTLKEFVSHYNPIQQYKDRTFKRYGIINDFRASTYKLLEYHYNYKVFTCVEEDNIINAYPGKIYHKDNSFFIIINNGWLNDEEIIKINLKK